MKSNDKRGSTVADASNRAPEAESTQAPAPESVTAPPQAPLRERRRKPRIPTTPPVPPPPPKLDDYEAILGKAELDELRFLAAKLQGKKVKMVNSTAVGGGVAEILNRLVPLMSELGLGVRWDVITGGSDFFEITKAF